MKLNQTEEHLRLVGDFECEDEGIENFLKNEAHTYDSTGEGNTYLLVDEENENQKKIVAYYTLKCNGIQVKYGNLHKVLPALEIARLGVDINHKGKGYGSIMLAMAVNVAIHLKEKHVGVRYIHLFSVPNALDFYKSKNKARLKFKEYPDGYKFLKEENSQEGCKALYITLAES
ncbi:GNAT family N-acetyltransferase [Clostridium perfringens]|uniref:GNAT family N-acetyltransferase n=1 Tax=Clostridium perfringens TaxID=1502 RepID=UPI002247AFCA|nr:GNAT family N-acetyltransferase [Clostridium perfringens]